MTYPRRPPVDNALVSGFRAWLEGKVSGDTADYYASVVEKGAWPPSREKHVKAWRKYAHYLFSVGRLGWEEYQGLLLYLKQPSKPHRTVEAVPDGLIQGYGERLRAAGMWGLHVLLLGGARLRHIVLMLEDWRPGEVVKHPHGRLEPRLACFNGWCRYYLGVREGSKRVDYVYYPSPWGPARPDAGIEGPYTRVRDTLNRLQVEASKYRKWVNQKLEELAYEHNIRLDAVNLIMSRGLSVTGAHYLNTRDWADRLFTIYTQLLEAVLGQPHPR